MTRPVKKGDIYSAYFPADNDEFGTTEFRKKIQDLAVRISEKACDSSSAYDGDEYGDGMATLYFNAANAAALWGRIEKQVLINENFAPSEIIRITSGGRRAKLTRSTKKSQGNNEG
ncbi:MAG: hypothetical protein H7A52_08370 [Akkermansiaceae bacterium]|nr:hypothetical protein [Akkermansiaceae bacterium]